MSDPVIQQDFHYQPHTGVLTARTVQPTEEIILARNAKLRNNPGSLRDLGEGSKGGSFGRQVASIPEIMVAKAVTDGYDIMSRDAQTAQREMQRYLASPDGKLCLVRDNTAKSSTKYFKGK